MQRRVEKTGSDRKSQNKLPVAGGIQKRLKKYLPKCCDGDFSIRCMFAPGQWFSNHLVEEPPLEKNFPPWLVWLRWLEQHPVDGKVAGSIPVQGTYLGCVFDPLSRHRWKAANWCFSLTTMFLSLPLSLSLSLKAMGEKMSSGEDKKNFFKKRPSPLHITQIKEEHPWLEGVGAAPAGLPLPQCFCSSPGLHWPEGFLGFLQI